MKKALRYAVLALITVIVLYPLVFVVMTSFKTTGDVLVNPFGIESFRPENYIEAWKIGKVGSYFMNSVVTTLITLAIQLVIIILASYTFGRLKPWGHKWIFILFLTGMFVTSEMITVPNFQTIKDLGLMGTRLALILPYVAMGIALATFIITNYIKGLPKEIEEAGIIDGCNTFQDLWYLTLPLMKPVLATVIIFNFQAVWNEFYWALIVVQKETLKTLPLGLMNFQSQFNTNYGVLCAGIVILIVPVIGVYMLASKQFISGMTSGAVKG